MGIFDFLFNSKEKTLEELKQIAAFSKDHSEAKDAVKLMKKKQATVEDYIHILINNESWFVENEVMDILEHKIKEKDLYLKLLESKVENKHVVKLKRDILSATTSQLTLEELKALSEKETTEDLKNKLKKEYKNRYKDENYNKLTPERDKSLAIYEFVCYTVETTCQSCNRKVPLGNINGKEKCPNCSEIIELDKKFRNEFLSTQWNPVSSFGSSQISVQAQKKNPNCENCHKTLEIAEINDKLKDLKCNKCEHINNKEELPDWIKSRRVFHIRFEDVKYKPIKMYIQKNTKESDEVISLDCTKCSANLKIDSKSPRNLECKYCGSNQYISDKIWDKMHFKSEPNEICILWERERN